jgi:ATP-binding cassette, subfamily B, heavy metal transporter
MRRSSFDGDSSKGQKKGDWKTILNLLPYLMAFKGRVALALSCLIAAKIANLGVPILLKSLIDEMSIPSGATVLVVPIALIIAYGALRLSASLFTELRELLFSRVTESAVRTVALQVFEHLHALSLRFHLSRQTGGMTRDIERGTRGIQSLISYSLYSIFPTFVELCLVLGYFIWAYDYWFAVITLCALVLYVIFTIWVTEWRTQYRRKMNELDSRANQRAIDSLINFETVKYFGNEKYEAHRYDENLKRYREAAIRSQRTLAFLNVGQQTIISSGLIFILWRATVGVTQGLMTLGDLVLVNVLMIQLYIPLNFLGVIYREIKQALTDMDRMFHLLKTDKEIADSPHAKKLEIQQSHLGPRVEFKNVEFRYEHNRSILKGLNFEMLPGQTTAVVGHSGAGKSTLARLLFRFYDVQSGGIYLDAQDIRDVTQVSLRESIGIVPQDTVLFNDTIAYNIAYGRPGAAKEEVEAAARAAQIHDFILSLPEGYETTVGERGLKLSGGEKQRVAIARTLLMRQLPRWIRKQKEQFKKS